jgi:mannose-6-phosphate isomerase-like protein (cupin superfamily)
MDFTTENFQAVVAKPWGREVLFTPKNLARVGKLLFINADKRLSFQYHDQKEETLCLISGQAKLWLEDASGEIQEIDMEPQKGYTVVPMQKHRLEGVTDCLVVEASSPETGTTFRIEDDFARPDETETLREDKNRGWQGNK